MSTYGHSRPRDAYRGTFFATYPYPLERAYFGLTRSPHDQCRKRWCKQPPKTSEKRGVWDDQSQTLQGEIPALCRKTRLLTSPLCQPSHRAGSCLYPTLDPKSPRSRNTLCSHTRQLLQLPSMGDHQITQHILLTYQAVLPVAPTYLHQGPTNVFLDLA